MIKVVAFDVFGTVFDMSCVPDHELAKYGSHIKKSDWSPIDFSPGWERIPAFKDSRIGIKSLRSAGFFVCTMTNCPVSTLTKLSRYNNINWDCIVPIELRQIYKPNQSTYTMALELFRVKPEEMLMVTANKTFGDIEACQSLGIQTKLIRGETGKLITDIVWEILPNESRT